MNRTKLTIIATTLLCIYLTGCTSSAPAKENNDTVVLRMAWWGSQTRHDRTVQAIELYERNHPEIDIEYEYYSYDEYFTKLKALTASDEVWDIFQLGGNFPMYQNKIEPLNTYVDQGIVDFSDVPEGYRTITEDADGNLVGFSSGINTYAIAYDTDLFRTCGIPVPEENWTWEDFAEAAETIHAKTGMFGVSGMPGSSEFDAGCSTFISQYGNVGEYSFFTPDLDSLGFDDPLMLEPYIQMKADLIRSGAAPDAGAAAEITNIENDFLVTGEAGMTWLAVNQFPAVYDLCLEQGRTLALASIPRIRPDGPTGAVLQSSQMLSVSKDSSHPEEAAAFISWFENSVECNTILQGERGIPVNNTVRDTLKKDLSEGQKIMYDFVDLVGSFDLPERINVLSPAGQDELMDHYKNYIQQVVYGEITAEEAARKTYTDAESLFK